MWSGGTCAAIVADRGGLHWELVNNAGLNPTVPTVPDTQTDSKLAF